MAIYNREDPRTALPQLEKDLNGKIDDLDDSFADRVVGQGVDGIWIWRKYESGIAECWGTYSWEATTWVAWGNVYECNSSSTTYPANLFVSTPYVNITNLPLSNGTYTLSCEIGGSTASKTTTPTFNATRATTGTNNVTASVSIHAIGKWK